MFCSFFSIVRSINGDHSTAAWAILFASFFDMVDGRLARMTKTQSDFGREYDSLVDLASFGLAPAILIYTWTLSQFRPIGWILSFIFFACAALRLARFNVRIDVVEKKRFQGLPSPPAACLLATLVLFYESLYGDIVMKSYVAVGLVPLLAVLMVSKVRYRSFKEYDMKKSNYFYILLGASVLIGLIAINPNIVLFAGFLIYDLSGPVTEVVLLKNSLKKAKPIKMRYRPRKLSVIDLKRDNSPPPPLKLRGGKGEL
jgi:CDP-diacylglycerol--serine O-phosphatidyltransferase